MARSPAEGVRRLVAVTIRVPSLTAALAVAGLTGLLVFGLAHEVFPYHSLNHDEGVYLQQAAMLLDGHLTTSPPVEGVFRPWFFVDAGDHLYPKYAPVTAAMFAVGGLLGAYRLALAVIAVAVVALVYATVAEAFDRRTGAVAALVLAATPLFLVQASVFLPYVPTLAWLLLFAWAFLRADRTGSHRWAALAGLGAGVGFFARPYTAVLFALPFVAHALWTMGRDGRPAIYRQFVTAAVGLLGVAVALGYNAAMTGSPLVFPYEAFAPHDGLGFGYRAILDHEMTYTPEIALETARVVVTQYVVRWSVAAPLGVVAAVAGVALLAVRRTPNVDRRLALAGIAPSILLGQLYFWGTYNAIGDVADPGVGLFGHLGPYYHLGLIVPTAALAAHALVVGWDRLWPRVRSIDGRGARVGALALALLLASLVGTTAVAGVDDTLEPNREVTAAYEEGYAPVDETEFEDALVFLPTSYGPWLNHPFQYLRNGPDYGGEVVYSMDRRVFEVLEAYPERTPYRFSYRGDWAPVGGDAVTPRLQKLAVVESDAARLEIRAGVPERTRSITVYADTGAGNRTTIAGTPVDGTVDLGVHVDGDHATVSGPSLASPISVPVDGRDTVDLDVFVDTGALDSLEYRLDLPVDRSGGQVRAVTPRVGVCSDARDCGVDDAYVPGAHRQGVWVETGLEAAGGETDG